MHNATFEAEAKRSEQLLWPMRKWGQSFLRGRCVLVRHVQSRELIVQHATIRSVIVHHQNFHVSKAIRTPVLQCDRRSWMLQFHREPDTEPPPSLLSIPISPSIISTRRLQIAKPSPVPPYLRVVEPSA